VIDEGDRATVEALDGVERAVDHPPSPRSRSRS
jgi:hypothetical protein